MPKNKLYIMCGLPFAGKTVLAKELAKRLGFVGIDLDEVKFELFGEDIKDEQIDQPGWDKVYAEMYRKIEENLRAGKTAIHDTGNFTKHERELVRQIADRLGIETQVIFVDVPVAVARKRMTENRGSGKRFDVSDQDFENSVKELERPREDEQTMVFRQEDAIDNWIEGNFIRQR
jgi:predicted kinase